MATFVFVHGSWQGAWCWRVVGPTLRDLGHEVVALNLPGHGSDSTPIETVTLESCVDKVIGTLDSQNERPILVGHSLSGGFITQAAEEVPDAIRALVYIASPLPRSGMALLQNLDGIDPEYLGHLVWSADRRLVQLSPKGARDFLYPLCPPAIVEEVVPLFTVESVAPYETPLRFTPERLGRVPAYYVECLRDRVIPVDVQRTMAKAVSLSGVFSVDSDHSPFFSAPDALASCLHAVAGEIAQI